MRQSRIPSPMTAEDILGARLNDLKNSFVVSSSVSATVSPAAGARRYITPGWGYTHVQATGVLVSVVNQVRCFRFVLLEIAEVSLISIFGVAGLAAGQTAVFGIYAGDGNELLVQCEIPILNGVAGARTGEADSTVLLPGDYWLAWSCDSVSPTFATNGPSTNFAAILNDVEPRLGIAANTMTGLELPAALGVVTASGTIGVPVVCIDSEAG